MTSQSEIALHSCSDGEECPPAVYTHTGKNWAPGRQWVASGGVGDKLPPGVPA